MSKIIAYRCNECIHFTKVCGVIPVCQKDHHRIKNHENGRMPCSEPREEFRQ